MPNSCIQHCSTSFIVDRRFWFQRHFIAPQPRDSGIEDLPANQLSISMSFGRSGFFLRTLTLSSWSSSSFSVFCVRPFDKLCRRVKVSDYRNCCLTLEFKTMTHAREEKIQIQIKKKGNQTGWRDAHRTAILSSGHLKKSVCISTNRSFVGPTINNRQHFNIIICCCCAVILCNVWCAVQMYVWVFVCLYDKGTIIKNDAPWQH